jgi:hypothetical protein
MIFTVASALLTLSSWHVQAETARWSPIIKQAGIRPE